ncbi:MAG: hypothetical protein HKN04_01760 [Rhodothermaceae bacterium]|nr:hypothetical protein [Rhodothermaceae bacterium]
MRIALFLALAVSTASARPIPPPDSLATADTTRAKVEIATRFTPTALYSSTRGFGVAGGLGIRNLGWEGSLIEIGARVSERFQSAATYLYTGDPYTTPLYGLIGGQIRTSTRQRFYGLGPLADRDNKLNLDFTSAQIEGRLGWYPLGHSGLLLQPGARVFIDRLSGFEDDNENGATANLDAISLNNLLMVQGETRTGVALGLQVSSDTRDRLVMTRHGMLLEASARRFFSLDDSDVQFNRTQVRLFGFYPLRGRRTVLIGRAVGVMVWGENDTTESLPFYYLPALDDALLPGYPAERFFGPDLVAAGAGVRLPIIDLVGRYGLDALLLADVGSVYDNIGDQFKLALSFDEDITADENGRVPLHPSLTFGLGVVNLDRNRAVAGVLFGFSPEGLVISGLRVVYDFRDLRPLFR